MSAICFLIAVIFFVVAAVGGHLTAHPLEWGLAFTASGLLLGSLGIPGPRWPWQNG